MWPTGRMLFSVLHLVVDTVLLLPRLSHGLLAFNFLWPASNTSCFGPLNSKGHGFPANLWKPLLRLEPRRSSASPRGRRWEGKGHSTSTISPNVSFQIPQTSDLEGLRSSSNLRVTRLSSISPFAGPRGWSYNPPWSKGNYHLLFSPFPLGLGCIQDISHFNMRFLAPRCTPGISF